MRNKIFSLLVLLMTAATGAWAQDYYLVGTMNDWGASRQFQLTQNPANPAEYMITLSLKAGAEFKVIRVGENPAWFPSDGNPNYGSTSETTIAAGKYTIYFRPDGQGGDDWFYHCIYLAAAPAPAIPVTEVGNNEWEFTMPTYAVVANIEYDTDLELQEANVNTTVLADWDGYEAEVTLKRALTTGMWNTFAVPFDISGSEMSTLGITAKELDTEAGSYAHITGFDETTGTLYLNFKTATSIEAGKPYLVNVGDNLNLGAIAFDGVIVSKTTVPVWSTDGKVGFIPTLGKTTIPAGDEKNVLFMASGSTLKHPVSLPTDMKGFRAYFQLKGEAANAASFNLDFGNGETTGINTLDNLTNSQVDVNAPMYNLAGQRVTKSYKGVVIQNGKKMVIK